MTLENFNYRTNPLFLRNQFKSDNKFGIPDIPKIKFGDNELKDLLLLGFNQLKRDNGKHAERIIHFFLYDYNFEKVWSNPKPYLKNIIKYKGMLTPDFSMYLEMPYTMQLYNTFRNRWCGAYFASNGIRVIPTVSWADEKSFEFCFQGIEKGSVVAVSTYMFHETKHHQDQKDIFLKGYNKMLAEIEPEKIICYSEPFSEMSGDIIYVDYEKSSWKYLYDDKLFDLTSNSEKDIIIKKYGYVCKGGGSAYGGKWKPKDERSARYLGKPNSILRNFLVKGNNGKGYKVDIKYDSEGRAIKERHHTDHNKPKYHTNPHDHEISWKNNHPDPGPPINYWDSLPPEFKNYTGGKIMDNEDNIIMECNVYGEKFETLGEFKFYLSTGWNLGMQYKGVEYGIEGHNNNFDIWIYNKGDIANGLTLEETLDFEFDGVKLRDFITTDDVEILERHL